MTTTRTIFTIGHSNHPIERFLELLRAHKITALADVRSRPVASYSRHFDKAKLEASLKDADIAYVFLGYGLGGKPSEPEFSDEEGYVRYDRIAATPAFAEALERLETGVDRFTVAMMCGEEDPRGCHRRPLVGKVLAERGIQVLHIRGDGRLQTEADLLTEKQSRGATAIAADLFGETVVEAATAAPWRSLWKSKAERATTYFSRAL